MCDEYVQHQRYRTHRVHEVPSQLDVPTSLTPAPSHLLHLHLVGYAKEVSNLIDHPVVNLLATRVGGANVVPECINLKLLQSEAESGSSARAAMLARGKKCLPETSRLGLISAMSMICPANSSA
jgi:hypothetical protein